MTATTPGLVCGHHHLYSALARGMPAPPQTPTTFLEILQQIWWRLDTALDLEMIRWSAMLGALEALEQGTTAIIDHHESPHAIEGSLDVIVDACAEVGVRCIPAYGVTDRHGHEGAIAGIAENERFLKAGGRGLVGIHAAFTCEDDTLAAAADLAERYDVGVHVHVCEGEGDAAAPERLAPFAKENWLLAHCVHMPVETALPGTILRFPMVYGPLDPQHRLFECLKRMDDGLPVILLGEGRARWRWTKGYVENLATAVVLAVTDDQAAGRIYNVGERETLTWAEWVRAIEHVMLAAHFHEWEIERARGDREVARR